MRVGLTGGVASGKSTVSAILAELGAVVIDADLLAREVVAKDTDGLAEVVAAFGAQVLTADGELDRPAVGAIVFADPEKRKALEAIIHPRVRRRGREMEVNFGSEESETPPRRSRSRSRSRSHSKKHKHKRRHHHHNTTTSTD